MFNLLFLFLIAHIAFCDGKEKICGHKYVGVGFDYLTNQFKFQIFKNTFNYSDPDHVWKNPFYPGQDEYVPEEMYLTNTPESFTYEGVMIHHIFDNYTREYSYHYSDSGLFSKHTEDIYYFIHRLFVYDNSKGFSYKRIAWYTLELEPLLMFEPSNFFHPTFQKAIDALPKDMSTEANQLAYQNFLKSFGTSYIRRAVMGGELQMNAWIHDCFLDQQTISWVHEQSSFSFLGIISWGHTRDQYLKQVSETFLEHVQMDMQSVGGVWRNGSTWDNYKLTLTGQKLQPIYYSFDPITDLISDVAKKQNLASTIESYVNEQTQNFNDWTASQKNVQPFPKPGWCQNISTKAY